MIALFIVPLPPGDGPERELLGSLLQKFSRRVSPDKTHQSFFHESFVGP
jgi:hypothetical protein